LFLVAHLDKRGFPVSAIKELYISRIEQDEYLDDIGIKFGNISASSKFKQMLRTQGIQGWLTTMEGNPPLEIFLHTEGGEPIEIDSHPPLQIAPLKVTV
jgi:hypothetical protein